MTYTPNYRYLAQAAPLTSPGYGVSPSDRRIETALPAPAYRPLHLPESRVDPEQLDRALRWTVLPVLGGDPVDGLQAVRRLGLRERIAELLTQLELRDELHQSTTARLKEGRLDTRSEIVTLERIAAFRDSAIDQRRAQLETRLEGLYRETTRAQQESWKDQRELREQLLELLGEYRLLAWRGQLTAEPAYDSGGTAR